MSDAPAQYSATFEDGWPDIAPIGLIILRSAVTPRASDKSVTEAELSWVVYLGTADVSPRLALFGELTVQDQEAIAAATVVMPITLREEPSVIEPAFEDQVLRQYGKWASSVLYDHVATVLRTSLSGTGYGLEIPYLTPEPELVFSDLATGGQEDS